MTEAQTLVQAAVAAATTATGADLVRVVDAASPIAHLVAAEITRQELGPWVEAEGSICLRIPGTTGNVVWDGLDYRARRLAAFKSEIPDGLTAEAINEMLEDPPRRDKWNELQAIRAAIKARFPKPNESPQP